MVLEQKDKHRNYIFVLLMVLSSLAGAQVADFQFNLAEGLSAISKYSRHIESFLPNWYAYEFDDRTPNGPQKIVDGGNDMYDTGNQISVSEIATSPTRHNIKYNVAYNYTEAEFLARTIYPFTGLLKIKNSKRSHIAYSMGVYGQGNPKSVVSKLVGNVTSGSFTIKYNVFQTSGAATPSICEIYFQLSSAKVVLSCAARQRELINKICQSYRDSTDYDPLTSRSRQNSTFPSQAFTKEHVQRVLGLIMRLLGKDKDDKCSFLQQPCHFHAECIGSPKVFKCLCKKGFEGNGVQCFDLDECSLNVHNCKAKSICQNTLGGFRCVCPPGLTGDGRKCTDVNECELKSHDCHAAAACINTDGSFTCKCKDGFRGDGKTCGAYGTTCNDDSMLFHISNKLFNNMDVALSDFYLQDLKCQGEVDKKNPDVWIFNVTSLQSCGTKLSSNETHLIYSNTLLNYIYTDRAQRISFSCSYRRELKNLPFLSASYKVLRSIANLTAPAGKGEYTAELNRYTDNTYTQIDNRTQYKTSDILYVMFKLLTSHKELNLVIDRCWITATQNPKESLSYSFIEKGCPRRRLGHVNITRSGQGTTAHFESKIFGFTNHATTYIHCTLKICIQKKKDACIPMCFDNIRLVSKRAVRILQAKRRRRQVKKEKDSVLSLGPLLTSQAKKLGTDENVAGSFFLPFLTALLICGTCSLISCFVFATCWITRRQN